MSKPTSFRFISWLAAVILLLATILPAQARQADPPAPKMVKDINPYMDYGSSILHGTVIGNWFYFGADDGSHGMELWRSDGTTNGTEQLTDMNGFHPGFQQSFGSVEVNGDPYFIGSQEVDNSEVWTLYKMDKTSRELTPLKNVTYAAPYLISSPFSQLFFIVDNEVWKSDGTFEGTQLIGTFSGVTVQKIWKELNGLYYFLTFDQSSRSVQIYATDGNQVELVLTQGPCQYLDYSHVIEKLGNKLFFSGCNAQGKSGLWETDGTASGTVEVIETSQTDRNGIPDTKLVIGEWLYFSVSYLDSDGWGPPEGGAVMRTQGAGKGVVHLGSFNYPVAKFVQLSDSVYFTGRNENNEDHLWKTDGSLAGTIPVLSTSEPYERATVPWIMNDKLYFGASSANHGKELWMSDGTPEGTVRISDINPGAADSSVVPVAVIGSALFVTANDGVHGKELWMFGRVPFNIRAKVFLPLTQH